MSIDKIKTIIRKEWADVFKHRLVLLSMLFIPLAFTTVPVSALMVTGAAQIGEVGRELAAQVNPVCPPGLTALQCYQLQVLNQFMLLFMFTPLILPVTIAAYSIVGEKTTHSLEPILATPITTIELLVGKNLAAAIPATIGTWFGFLIYVGAAGLLMGLPLARALPSQAVWWVALLLIGPQLSILSVNFAMMVSSRVNEPHVAEQLSALVVLPLLLIFFGQVGGYVILGRSLILQLAVVLVGVDGLLFCLAVRVFDRETILSRWR